MRTRALWLLLQIPVQADEGEGLRPVRTLEIVALPGQPMPRVTDLEGPVPLLVSRDADGATLAWARVQGSAQVATIPVPDSEGSTFEVRDGRTRRVAFHRMLPSQVIPPPDSWRVGLLWSLPLLAGAWAMGGRRRRRP